MLSSNNTRDNSTHGYHKMVNTKIRLTVFFAAEDERFYEDLQDLLELIPPKMSFSS